MSKLNITQASRATGKNRTTLYRHIENGTLSAEKDATDTTVIDVSELQRVYGEIDVAAIDATSVATFQTVAKQQSDTVANQHVQLLEAKLQHIEERLEFERERRHEVQARCNAAEEREKKLLEIVEKQNLMLSAPQESKPGNFFARLFSAS